MCPASERRRPVRSRFRIHYRNLGSLISLAKALSRKKKAGPSRAQAPVRAQAKRMFRREALDFRIQLADDLQRYQFGGFVRRSETIQNRGYAEYLIKKHIRLAYRNAFLEGKAASGGAPKWLLSDTEERWLRKLRYDEFKYLKGFLDDIDIGQGTMPYERRMRMYADAIHGPFWAGWVLGNQDRRRQIIWVLGESEHCETCQPLGGRVWTASAFMKWVMKTGILPRQGTKCLSACRCHLEERFV